MKITVFGSGYVGLVTGACFAEMGNHVLCMDVDKAKVDKLNQGISPIYEPGLANLIQKNKAKGYLSFTTDAKQAVTQSKLLFIAVGTPPEEDGSADLKHVLSVAQTIGTYINDYKVIVNKSTVPVGTADRVQSTIDQTLVDRGCAYSFDVVSNPEFLKEGSAISDCMKPDRIIIGTSSTKARKLMHEVYLPFSRHHEKIITMDERSAEMTKYVANAILATKISFMNEMSQIAEKVGADIENVRIGIGADARIGYSFIYPGCGYGGSCFPKDVKALRQTANDATYKPQLLNAVESVNENQKQVLFDKIYNHYDGHLAGKVFAIWGLAFKPNTDDLREAPARVLIENLWAHGAYVQAYDPQAMANFQSLYGVRDDYLLCSGAYDVLSGADALCVVTEWPEFRSPDFDSLAAQLKDKAIFDGRNLYGDFDLDSYGLSYYAIGR